MIVLRFDRFSPTVALRLLPVRETISCTVQCHKIWPPRFRRRLCTILHVILPLKLCLFVKYLGYFNSFSDRALGSISIALWKLPIVLHFKENGGGLFNIIRVLVFYERCATSDGVEQRQRNVSDETCLDARFFGYTIFYSRYRYQF